ncbi:hypothetical protein [Paenibacillus terrigena]|uniref:hypothetical protein n=1 Tax=Paenibacillus terrigena TaxID=369333 RepID=UPI0028D5EFC0|nr:hypothetical protein [Paenibacillus terrigena]
MNSSLEPNVESSEVKRRVKKGGASAKWFLVFWIVMIGLGVYATYLYSNHMKQTMITELQSSTNKQLAEIKSDYAAQLNTMHKEIETLKSKVDTFNELLTFTKDNASNKTDNSNKLYSQLNEVKQKLDALQKKMDLLK